MPSSNALVGTVNFPTYSVITIEQPGPHIGAEAAYSTTAVDIDNYGVVYGQAYSTTYFGLPLKPPGFTYSNGQYTPTASVASSSLNIGFHGPTDFNGTISIDGMNYGAYITASNSHGDYAGYYYPASSPHSIKAFVYSFGHFTKLDVPGMPIGINDADQVVGNAFFDGGGYRAFVANPIIQMNGSASGYDFSTLDFPGTTDQQSFGGYRDGSSAIGINENGQVLGAFTDVKYVPVNATVSIPNVVQGNFIYHEGIFDLASSNFLVSGGLLPAGTYIAASDINNYGNFSVGYWTKYPYIPSEYVGSGINDAGDLVGGNNGSFGDIYGANSNHSDVNNFGQISYNSGGHGFISTSGISVEIDFPNAISTSIYGINDVGQIVGTYIDAAGTHGFIETRGVFSELTMPNGTAVIPESINNLGQVVGSYIDSTGMHGFLANPKSEFTLDTLTVQVSEDAWAYHPHAQFVIEVDGKQVGDVHTVTASHAAGETQNFTIMGNLSGSHQIGISFLNDQYGGTNQDVNLYVDNIILNGVAQKGNAADVNPSIGAQLESSTGLFTNGTGHFEIAPDTLTFRVSEDAWAYHPDAQFVVLVDGKQIGDAHSVTALHSSGQTQDVTIVGDFSDAQNVQVQFLNDQYGGSDQDVNLYVDSFEFNGVHHSGSQGTSDSNVGGQAGSAFELTRNGTANFKVAQSTLTLQVSEDAYQGDADFLVMVDGRTIGGVQTATASHALGQLQTISLQGDFNGAQKVAVQFINDKFDGSGYDRNLYIESVSVNESTVAGHDATVPEGDGQTLYSAELWRDTIATFDVSSSHHHILQV